MSKAVVQDRVARFQALLEKNRIDAVMIRNIYSFTYFAGVQWWQPSLLIPQKGEPTIFVFGDEAEELREKTWITNILGYRKVEELMKAVVDSIRKTGAQTVGFDVDVDQSALLYEAFKSMHASRKIVDVHGLIMQLRMVKDASEIERIRKASDCARIGLEAAVKSIRPGVTETAIAAEAQFAARRKGAESALVYVMLVSRVFMRIRGTRRSRRETPLWLTSCHRTTAIFQTWLTRCLLELQLLRRRRLTKRF